MTRTAKTRSGKTVTLNRTVKVDDGWEGYVLDGHGYAVKVFIPAK